MSRYRFGFNPEFDFWVRERRLLADGRRVCLGDRALDVLTVLVEQAGQVVTRRTLIDRVWPDVAVEDNNLNVQISSLRKALGPAMIQTVAGRGYTFTLMPRACIDPAAADPLPRLKTHLPATLTTLIGRETELAELQRLTEAHRVVTVLGPGGIGKTLIAQHLLRAQEHRFAHGVCFVDLSVVRDADSIPGAIASCLQLDAAAGATLAGLVQALAPLEMMLVLDNAEHLAEGLARVVRALHDTAARLRLVVTSQAPLRLASERQYRVGPLEVPAEGVAAAEAMGFGAIALFVDRARAVDARFALDDDAAAAAIGLCRALDGLPLAIELAAWRAPTLGVRRLAESMREPLKLLAAPDAGAAPRLRTLRNALAWSHGLLDRRAQVVWRRLGVLTGSADLWLVQAVAVDPPGQGDIGEPEALEALFTLVERSLVSVVRQRQGEVRYRLLDTPRAYAREQLAMAGEAEVIGQRHADARARWFRRAYAERFTGREPIRAWHDRLQPDVDDGHAALAWLRQRGQHEPLCLLLPGLMLATPREDVDRHRTMQDLAGSVVPRQGAPRLEAIWTLAEASISRVHCHQPPDIELAHRAVALARAADLEPSDRRWFYRTLCHSAVALLNGAGLDEGRRLLEEARAIEDPGWPAVFAQRRWLAEVWLADRLGDGAAMYRASLRYHALSVAAGMPGSVSAVTMVNSALADGRADEAVDHGRSVLAQLAGGRQLADIIAIRTLLMAACIAGGRLTEARAESRAVWPLVLDIGRPYEWADYQALLCALEGRPAEAALLLGYADHLYARRKLVRTHNEAVAVCRAHELIGRQLAPRVLDRLLADGASLQADEVHPIAFGRTGHGGQLAGPARGQGPDQDLTLGMNGSF